MSAPVALPIPSALANVGITEVVGYALPLTRTFRRTTVREGLLLRGPAGWGEWAPFPEYDDAAAARWLAAAVEAATTAWPAAVRDTVAVNAIVPALPPDEAAAVAAQAYEQSGCTTVKVKVADPGEPLAADVARVHAVRDALPSHARVRVDANGGWTLAQAREVLPQLGELEYVEQPCRTLADCARVRESGVPVAVDEGLRLADDPDSGRTLAAIRAAADVVVVKVAPLGGVRRALAIAGTARPAGRGQRRTRHGRRALRRHRARRGAAGPAVRRWPGHRPTARPGRRADPRGADRRRAPGTAARAGPGRTGSRAADPRRGPVVVRPPRPHHPC